MPPSVTETPVRCFGEYPLVRTQVDSPFANGEIEYGGDAIVLIVPVIVRPATCDIRL